MTRGHKVDGRGPVRGTIIAGLALALTASSLMLAGCSSDKDAFSGKGSPIYPGDGPLPKGGGRYQIGKPYTVAGQRFYPKADPDYDKTGVASWYGPKFNRRMTSNGEWFDMDYMSAAHTTLPLPSYAKVTNLENGREIVVRVNDRGPFVNSRIIDLSKKSAETLGFRKKGKAKVRVQYIGRAPLDDKGTHLAAMNTELHRGTSLNTMIAAADRRTSGGTPTMVAKAEPSQRPAARKPQGAPVTIASLSGQAAAGSGGAATNAVVQPAGAGFYVQAAAFSDPDNADRTRAQLAPIGPVEVAPLSQGSRTLYRVRVGPLRDAGQADQALRQVVAAGHSDARVIVAAN